MGHEAEELATEANAALRNGTPLAPARCSYFEQKAEEHGYKGVDGFEELYGPEFTNALLNARMEVKNTGEGFRTPHNDPRTVAVRVACFKQDTGVSRGPEVEEFRRLAAGTEEESRRAMDLYDQVVRRSINHGTAQALRVDRATALQVRHRAPRRQRVGGSRTGGSRRVTATRGSPSSDDDPGGGDSEPPGLVPRVGRYIAGLLR
jgi:hypothetical protein